MSDSYLIRHEQCPQCKSLGKDNGRNNLGVYSDDHTFCFSCGHSTNGNKIKKYTESFKTIEYPSIILPEDASTEIPPIATRFLDTYGFTKDTCTKHTIMWSERRQMLLFPYFIKGKLLAWQGRLFGTDKQHRKWFTQGNVNDIVYTLGRTSRSIILVESIISAILLSRVAHTSPIFGSVVSDQRLLRLAKMYDRIVIWLDPDKQTIAINAANKARLFGLDVHVVLSDKKPKDYTLEEIKVYLNES